MAVEPPPAITVELQLATDEAVLPEGSNIELWVDAAVRAGESRRHGVVTVRVVGIAEGRSLNETYRGKTGATNVLAFPAATGAGIRAEEPPELGDVVICLPVVYREAAEQHKAAVAHLAHLAVHGALHLLGHTHDGDTDSAAMEACELSVLASLGFADPYASERTEVTAGKTVR